MSHNLNDLTLGNLYQELFTSVSYKNLAARYRARLLSAVAGQNEAASANRDPDLIEAAATEVERLIPQALGIFRLITAAPTEDSEGSDFVTTQIALHEYLLKTLYHINRNCRTLLEAQVNYDQHESIEAYLRSLKKLHGIADMPMLVALQKSHEADETLFYGLVERECTLKVFDMGDDGVCFQIYNKQRDEVLQVLEEARTDKGLAISRRYFFFRIFQVFQHLYVISQLCDLAKSSADAEESIDEVEVGEYLMGPFNQAAADIL